MPAAIFNGSFVKILKDNLKFKSGVDISTTSTSMDFNAATVNINATELNLVESFVTLSNDFTLNGLDSLDNGVELLYIDSTDTIVLGDSSGYNVKIRAANFFPESASTNLGAGAAPWGTLYVTNVGTSLMWTANNATLKTINDTATNTFNIESGNASAGDSGDVVLRTGTATGDRGTIDLIADQIDLHDDGRFAIVAELVDPGLGTLAGLFAMGTQPLYLASRPTTAGEQTISVGLATGSNDAATPTGETGDINLYTGNISGTNAGAHTTGTMYFYTGNNTGNGDSGGYEMVGGSAVDGNSGIVRLESGNTSGTGNTGSASLKSGSAAGSGDSGDVVLEPGSVDSGTRGSIRLNSAQINFQDKGHLEKIDGSGAFSGAWGADAPALLFRSSDADVAAGSGAGLALDSDAGNNLIIITSDQSSANSTAALYLATGYSLGTGNTGDISLYTGGAQGASGNTGPIVLQTGQSDNGDSGPIQLTTGAAPNGTQGDVVVNAPRLDQQQGFIRFFNNASDPAGAVAGDVYFNTTVDKLKVYNGTTWETITSV